MFNYMPSTTRHPYAYTLDLLKLALDRLPPTFPEKEAKGFRGRLEYFGGHRGAGYVEIQATIAELGRKSWPYRMAYEELYRDYGRASEEAHLMEKLDRGIREKYEKFIHDGGKLNHIESAKSGAEIWTASPFERYFTPEEKFAIEQALLAARDAARKEINEMAVGKRAEEYSRLVRSFQSKQAAIEAKLADLKKMAAASERWKPLIEDKVSVFEEGWSILGSGIDEETVDRELEYWRGSLEAFLNA
jgi:hypothetical protein